MQDKLVIAKTLTSSRTFLEVHVTNTWWVFSVYSCLVLVRLLDIPQETVAIYSVAQHADASMRSFSTMPTCEATDTPKAVVQVARPARTASRSPHATASPPNAEVLHHTRCRGRCRRTRAWLGESPRQICFQTGAALCLMNQQAKIVTDLKSLR